MPSTEFLAWTQLPTLQRRAEWRSFIVALDVGDAGYHRFYPVLMPLWDRGEVPDLVNDEQLAMRDAELLRDALHDRSSISASEAGVMSGIPAS